MSPKKKRKCVDWANASFDHFLLKVSYVGTNYLGNAYQIDVPTVEGALFEACTKANMIEDRTKCAFSRCGRTDKGVHGRGNYVSMDLRLRPGKGDEPAEPYDYHAMLNRMLPNDIRILSVHRVPTSFDARFNCLYRVYRYFFWATPDLDLDRMEKAAQLFVGEHDFRNICKMDLENTRNHRRRIMAPVAFSHSSGSGTNGSPIVHVTIKGLSFLYHQIRCMMSILFMIGRGHEEPSVITELLDVKKNPRKPVYDLADPSGLVLWDCCFEGVYQDEGQRDETCLDSFFNMYQHSVKMSAIFAAMGDIAPGAHPKPNTSRHQPLWERATAPSLEEKLVLLGEVVPEDDE